MDIQAANNLVGVAQNELPRQQYNVVAVEQSETAVPDDLSSSIEEAAREEKSPSSSSCSCVDTYA